MAAPLHEHGLEAGVVAAWCGAAVLLVGQVDARGAVQLLQLVLATLLLNHPAFLGFRGVGQRAGPVLGGHSMSICTAGLHGDVCARWEDDPGL